MVRSDPHELNDQFEDRDLGTAYLVCTAASPERSSPTGVHLIHETERSQVHACSAYHPASNGAAERSIQTAELVLDGKY